MFPTSLGRCSVEISSHPRDQGAVKGVEEQVHEMITWQRDPHSCRIRWGIQKIPKTHSSSESMHSWDATLVFTREKYVVWFSAFVPQTSTAVYCHTWAQRFLEEELHTTWNTVGVWTRENHSGALHDLCSATVSIGFSSIKSPVAHSHKMSQQVVLNPTRIYSFSVESSASIHESFQTNLENVLKQWWLQQVLHRKL